MRLTELDPQWINHGDRKGVGVRFWNPLRTRPDGSSRGMVRVLFANPIDGGPPLPNDDSIASNNDGCRWQRSGDTFETLTLSPSIDEGEGGWHGFVTNGGVS